MIPPTFTTDRLIIRACNADDHADTLAMWNDPDVIKHIGNRTRDAQDTWFKMARDLGMWGLVGYGYWVVRERNTDAFVGEVGFSDFKRGLDHDISEWPEAGWALVQAHWGKGYATEALRAAHDWFAKAHPGRETSCIIDIGHTPSERVAEKLGYEAWQDTIYREDRIRIYRRPAG